LANQRLPFGLQVKCHLIPCPFLWSGLRLPSLGQAQPMS
jgi:hypothetical protein